MKSIFDKPTREALIIRIHSLDKNSTAQWGRMNVYQMVKHCTVWNEWVLGKSNLKYKQEFLGLIFGKMALNNSMKDDRPMKKNMPAGRGFTIMEKNGDVELQKKIWAARVAEYEHYSQTPTLYTIFLVK